MTLGSGIAQCRPELRLECSCNGRHDTIINHRKSPTPCLRRSPFSDLYYTTEAIGHRRHGYLARKVWADFSLGDCLTSPYFIALAHGKIYVLLSQPYIDVAPPEAARIYA
ncbi:hypothetical protein NHQ30_005039 [Ciborinia camelliae]|nr:hypothetical protein NHQ30_005039 [Ciborinia camelliae]